jgi:cyclopropane-fatty-acyl-phospholipid synthase
MLEVSEANVRHHYDLGNDFYRLWLDESMTYSCALFEDGDSLADAQRRKLDHLIALAGAAGKPRVLDVGCGWGALLRRLVDVHGVERAVGLNLSQAQVDQIRALGHPKTEVRLESWSAHAPPEPYDAIINCGSLEHFCRQGVSRDEAVEAYRDFFAQCHRLLRPGGLVATQAIARGEARMSLGLARDALFIDRMIFPDSALPRAADLMRAVEGMFELTSLRNDRAHYERTCAEWLGRLRERRQEAVAVVGEDGVANYERYLGACVRLFRGGQIVLLRFGLRRVG